MKILKITKENKKKAKAQKNKLKKQLSIDKIILKKVLFLNYFYP
jgi:hypothetical protein